MIMPPLFINVVVSSDKGLWRLSIKLLLPTKSELGGWLDRDEKDVFAVNAKALYPPILRQAASVILRIMLYSSLEANEQLAMFSSDQLLLLVVVRYYF
jgi:hypothetical protein